jgi:hypothetical protein
MAVNRLQSALSSRKVQRALPWIAGGVLALGVITFLQVMNRPKSTEATKSTRPAKVLKKERTVPPSPEARQVVAKFINTAVARKNLAAAWRISGPNIRAGLTRKQWMTGDIPVVPYDVDRAQRAPVRLDWSYPNEASFQVILLAKKGSAEKDQAFFITVKKFGKGKSGRWLVDYWAPYAPPAVPDELR